MAIKRRVDHQKTENHEFLSKTERIKQLDREIALKESKLKKLAR